jgi:hypothetical protein
MTAWCDCRGSHLSFADRSVQRRLADSQQAGGRSGSNEPFVAEILGILESKPAVPARSDDRRLEQPPRDGAKNCRPADAETLC